MVCFSVGSLVRSVYDDPFCAHEFTYNYIESKANTLAFPLEQNGASMKKLFRMQSDIREAGFWKE